MKKIFLIALLLFSISSLLLAQEDDIPDYVPDEERERHSGKDNYKLDEQGLPVIKPQGHARLKLFAGLGYNYRTGSISEQVGNIEQSHLKKLKPGPTVSSGAVYYIFPTYGIGFRFDKAWYNNRVEDLSFFDNNGNYLGDGTLSDNIEVEYYGFVLSSRWLFGDLPASFQLSTSMGMVYYFNQGYYLEYFEMEGTCFGSSIDMGINFYLDRNWGVGFEFSYFSATLSTYTYNGMQTTSYLGYGESLHRLQLLGQITYKL